MYLCACWIVMACYRSCIFLLMESLWPVIGHVFVCLLNRCGLLSVNKHTNTWPITGHNNSTSTQIHDRSEATTIQQAHKYMTDNRPRFHVESLWPVIGHVFVCLWNRCGLWAVMFLCASGIVVGCEGHSDSTSRQKHYRSQATIQQAHTYMTDHRPQLFH
jgi:hypothetical protein